jgi:hypothetical protein
MEMESLAEKMIAPDEAVEIALESNPPSATERVEMTASFETLIVPAD